MVTMLPSPADVQTPPEEKGGRNNPEVDFVNAMKRFLVRADVVTARKCRAAGPLIWVIRTN
ncbi:hypothetical protein [Bradyrhizobium sp.]|uniref:hypothetical protein n=1 Tax=Bradyrhizobium sp. TaxID=376 RepID=UPI002638A87C|nr:hypothetical protein [Bradyrhizobium sp.]